MNSPESFSLFKKRPVSASVLRKPHGFMLLEAMIAVGIFAFAVVGLAYALNMILSTEKESRFEQDVRQLVESRLAEARADQMLPGTIALPSTIQNIELVRTIEPSTWINRHGAELPNLYRVEITATQQGQEILTSEIYVYRP